ncbi:hypothetical protein O1Q96_29205 [Streptomyces sp. Qhu-G9]|uniref:hypothetical protein n=1 Tax=Streptomyces sp. Qhu-G9 TaxID=3452799 RepID=UPI0022ABF885|nr:hypothetical protein [Streptomyces aurantiacus]WAU83409.1 hypothetical protein O1Q96_29205 [Streptomyces aurantiacus]
MISRRSLIGAAAGAGVLAVAQGALGPAPANAAEAAAGDARWTRTTSANGWRIDPDAIAVHHIEGSARSVPLHQGDAAAVLLHIARRWHYEIGAVDSGEGGGITAHTTRRTVGADFESNHLSGTAIALHPRAYPLAGSEGLWPHHEQIVRDILVDCEGTVVWGGDLTPVKRSHFHIAARPGDKVLARVAAGLDTSKPTLYRAQTAGTVADPAAPARRVKARRLQRATTG